MLIIINFCLTEHCGRNVVFLEMENTSVQVIVILLILLKRRCSKLVAVASEDLQNYKARKIK